MKWTLQKKFWTTYTIPELDRLLVELDENAVALYTAHYDFGKLEFFFSKRCLLKRILKIGLVHLASSIPWWLER